MWYEHHNKKGYFILLVTIFSESEKGNMQTKQSTVLLIFFKQRVPLCKCHLFPVCLSHQKQKLTNSKKLKGKVTYIGSISSEMDRFIISMWALNLGHWFLHEWSRLRHHLKIFWPWKSRITFCFTLVWQFECMKQIGHLVDLLFFIVGKEGP